ncbi:hydroxyethylthiazole kinase [[Pantoea] beijingensis]|uniref:Hydroxyethylthiazole kinase n=1 Tax=[Pantoea] beijingensis TaxID=1324864 RepID=A0A443IB77_9GAMM|nr:MULTISPECIES: hydroxyethylthiazole kinase [Erwiniaceae]RWR01157.1 hydroxyethylthiazole kinase [[Pantoea] beijingensis]
MHQPLPVSGAIVAEYLSLFRQQAPLVHCMTNDVVQSFTANVLLALGGSPAMVIEAEEAAQFSAIADGLLINVGTLTRSRADAMLSAVGAAVNANTPWTLDPVAVGGLTFRSEFCRRLLVSKPAAIRGNASEILALSGNVQHGRGVDSQHQAEAAIAAATQLARQTGAVVVVTGAIDYVTDGEQLLQVMGGSPLMTRVVGTGCALSAVVTGFTALAGDRLYAIASACRVMSCAGERATARSSGPGSFAPAFLDELWQLDAEVLA